MDDGLPVSASRSGVNREGDRDHRDFELPAFFSILAQVSFSAMVRLNTSLPGAESESTQKYPRRSN